MTMACAVDLTPTTRRDEALGVLKRAFAAAGIDTPDLDARLLLCDIAGIDATKLITSPATAIGDAAEALTGAMKRRLAREPVSRILGWREFYGRRFDVTPATLDPRADSETLIDSALDYVRLNGGVGRPWRVLDIGTGTGCLLITLLCELPCATGVGIDLSSAALAVARSNGALHAVADRVAWQVADGPEAVAPAFDILISNPPYIRTSDIAALAPEVRQFDPALALDGGNDGLDFYRRIARDLGRLLTNGVASIEIGYDQADAVTGLMLDHAGNDRWPRPAVRLDLAGNSRCVVQTTRW